MIDYRSYHIADIEFFFKKELSFLLKNGFKIISIVNSGPEVLVKLKKGKNYLHFVYDQRGGSFDILIFKKRLFSSKIFSFTQYLNFNNPKILIDLNNEGFYKKTLYYAPHLEKYLMT